MAENLVVNGQTYEDVDSLNAVNEDGEPVMFYPDAVRYVEQNLTPEQKAQARSNIGAVSEDEMQTGGDVFVATIGETTRAEIYQQAKTKTVLGIDSGAKTLATRRTFVLARCTTTEAVFVTVLANGDIEHRTVTNDESAMVQNKITSFDVNVLKYAQPKGEYITNDKLSGAVNDALAQAKASGEFDGTSVTVKSVSESMTDGGSNVVTFSDGKTLTVKNGSKGSTGDKGDKGDTGAQGPKGEQGIQGEKGEPGAIETPKIVSSVDEMTDTTKHYVLDGYIWHNKTVVTEGSTTITHPNLFVPGTAELNKRYSLSSGSLSSSNGYFMTDYIELVDFGNTTPYNANLNWECLVDSATDAKFILFNANKEKIGASFIKTTYQNITVANGKSVIDLKTINTSGGGSQPTASEVAYVRFQLPAKASLSALTSADIAGLEITFDAITKTETTEGTITQEWVNSGISYAPTFKTDLIGVLGENNVIYLSDNLPSGTYTLKYPDNDYETLGTFTK